MFITLALTHIRPKQSKANQWNGFYIIVSLGLHGLRATKVLTCHKNTLCFCLPLFLFMFKWLKTQNKRRQLVEVNDRVLSGKNYFNKSYQEHSQN